jgi:hypothetical protein
VAPECFRYSTKTYQVECLTRIGGYCMGSEFTASPQWLDCSLLDHSLIAVIMLFPGCF